MPSLRTLILSLAFMAMALFQLSTASPVPSPSTGCSEETTPTLPVRPEVRSYQTPPQSHHTQKLTHPQAATNLPSAPPAGQTFVAVALGRGVQNYTCANTTTAPVSIGAVATLFDGTQLASINEAAFNALPAIAVYAPLPTLPAPISKFAVLGNHFFGADGTPTFNLASKGKILYAKKAADIKAPADANKGPAGTGAVDWLELVAKPGYASVGLQTVYRVVTAGGAPPAVCPSVGVISVQYAAEYWFYD